MADREKNCCHPWLGVAFASLVYLLWLGNLVFWLHPGRPDLAWGWALLGVAVQTLLYTGLFITAHDAMHHAVAPGSLTLNRWIGRIAVWSYALMKYSDLQRRHGLHHSYPASAKDPDFHDGRHAAPLRWYLHFMLNYLSGWQIAGMALLFNLLQHGLGIAVERLLLFWVLPAFLSTVQLFYFGTCLPHRERGTARDAVHRARSSGYPAWLSLLTCYHFGYHLEHHLFPRTPWWRLPRRRL